MRIPNDKNLETKRTYELQLWPCVACLQILRHSYVFVCSRHFGKDYVRSDES